MGEFAVIVNGVPGAGKTTLSSALQRELDLPLISKDAVKEALADAVIAKLPTSRLGAIASDAAWALVGLVEGPVIVESFWLAGRDDLFFEKGLCTGGIHRGVEVWCQAPLPVMRERFCTRSRHFAHQDASRISKWERFARAARPISSFPVARVDTGAAVDTPALADLIRSTMAQ